MALELVTFIVQNLASDPSQLEVTREEEGRDVAILIRCAPEDAGRIIGRGGRIISSIRTLARAASDGQGRVDVTLLDAP